MRRSNLAISTSFCNPGSDRYQTAIHPKPRHNCQDANPGRNQHIQIELRWDFKTMKDRKRTAPKFGVIHRLQSNVPNCPPITIHNPPKIRGNAATITWIVVGLQIHGNPIAILFQPPPSDFPSRNTGRPRPNPITILTIPIQSWISLQSNWTAMGLQNYKRLQSDW